MGLPVGLAYDGAGHVVLDPDAGVQQALRAPVRGLRPHRLGPRRGRRLRRREAAVPGADQHRAAQGRAGLDAADPLAGAAYLAQSPLCRRVRLRPAPRNHQRQRQEQPPAAAPRPVDRAGFPAPTPDTSPGRPTRPTRRSWLGNAAARGTDRAAGQAREGTALLQGLAICGRCGRRMTVPTTAAAAPRSRTTSACARCIDNAGPRCQTIPGAPADAAIGQLLLGPHPADPRGRPHRPGRDRSPRRRSRRHATQPRRARPLPRRPGPPPLPGRRPGQPAGRREPGSRLEPRRCAPCKPPRTTTTTPARPAPHSARDRQGPHPGAGRRLPRPVGRPRDPAARTQADGPAARSTTSP